jgi:hypothetical protein
VLPEKGVDLLPPWGARNAAKAGAFERGGGGAEPHGGDFARISNGAGKEIMANS